MATDKHKRLAEEALKLKTAWLCAVVMTGCGTQVSEKDMLIPNYHSWDNKALKRHIFDLECDFEAVLKHLVRDYSRSNLTRCVTWLAERFNSWSHSGFGIFEVGRVHEVESAIGKLKCRDFMDCPPYAQILFQGHHRPAIRHPEYHLGSDLALLFNLLLDSEAMLDEAGRRRELHCSEQSQSLARSVILTCFNLLEAFVSGIATAWIIENPSASPEVLNKLQDKKLSLRRRLIEYPAIIAGKAGALDVTKPPFEPLFRECKNRRDSFVHCEPGPKLTTWGYVKESEFHSADLVAARRTVDLTFEAISRVWRLIHGREKPSWLPKRTATGHFERVFVRLIPKAADLDMLYNARNSEPRPSTL